MTAPPAPKKDALPETPVPRRHHLVLMISAALMLSFILWASLARIDEVARGEGTVIPSSEVQAIQSLDGGIVEDLPAREGETVEAGDILLRLRNVEAASDLSAARQKYLGLMASIARLRAAAEGGEPQFPEEVLQDAPGFARAESDTLKADRDRLKGQLEVLAAQKAQKEQETAELERRIADTERLLKLAREERAMVAPLVSRGAASRMSLLQADRQIAEREAELAALNLSLPRAASAVEEFARRASGLEDEFRANARRELSDKTAEAEALSQSLAAFRERSARTEIRSPVRGIVKDIRIKTVGGVVRPGETIMEIVPLGDTLIIEGRIRPADIAFIHPGQKATVRLSAFDFSVYGALEGEVRDVSADAITTERGDSFYRVRVITEKAAVEKDGRAYPIIPGMQATIDIITGKRTVMVYLLRPLLRGAQTALRER